MILGVFFQCWRLRWSIHAANFNPDAFIGYCWGPEHDGTYIVENWWINFIEITRRYTDYIPKINNLMAQLAPDYYWWIHVQVWSMVFSNNLGGLHGGGGIHGTPHRFQIADLFSENGGSCCGKSTFRQLVAQRFTLQVFVGIWTMQAAGSFGSQQVHLVYRHLLKNLDSLGLHLGLKEWYERCSFVNSHAI